MAKSNERLLARELRRKGEGVKTIAKQVGVSPSSVSAWCKDIILTPEQIHILEIRSHDPHYGRRLEYALKQREIRLNKTKRLIDEGKKEIGGLNQRELFLIGVALYWAEGFKKDSQAGLASTDPYMIKIFIKWLYECFRYSKKDLCYRLTVNISHQNRIENIEEYWAKTLNISKSDFQKPFYQNVLWKKKYDNPENYYGVLRVKVRKSTDFLRKINGWIQGLYLNTNF
jgi:transcriptional regulator with XRE-family HTH domain